METGSEKTNSPAAQKQTKNWSHDTPDKGEVESEPPSEIYSDMFSIDMAPPSFGAPPPVATYAIHEPTDLKWDPSSDDQVGSPRKEVREDSSNEFMPPVQNKQHSDDQVSSPKRDESDDSRNEFMPAPVRDSSEQKIHRKGRESYGNVISGMSFFEKFGEKTDEGGDAPVQQKSDDASNPQRDVDPSSGDSRNEFMPAPVRDSSEQKIHRKGRESYGNVISGMSFFEKFGEETNEGEDPPVHQKSDDAFKEFGSQSEDANHEGANVNKITLQSEESSDPFMAAPEKNQQPKVHRKGKESYGNVISGMSFFEKFGDAGPERSTEPAPVRTTEVRSIPSMRAPDPVPQSKISTLITPEEVRSIPQHRQKQASIGFAISELSFSQKFGIEDNDDPPPVFSVTEDVDPPFDIGEEASTSEISGNNENEEIETLRQEMKLLRDQLETAHQKIQEQQNSLSTTERELQACKDSKIQLIIASSNEITRLKETIGMLAKCQQK